MVRQDAEHIKQAESGNGALRRIGLRLILAPVALRMLEGVDLLHQRLSGYGEAGCLYFRVAGRAVENVDQRPVAHRGILRLEQPGEKSPAGRPSGIFASLA